ncbi:MAG: Gfo/Idh/MocA family oxidoreductase [Candidatus Eremiobacteraeota bacterium]|nr:Gfo/Idh/MocA family oxidoreductase [Candidatus Eremiobacteraeota bacterium]
MAQAIRVGIVGSGFGVKAHLPAYVAHPRFEVVALASPSSAAQVAKERNIPHAFADCAGMLAGCELDLVSIAAPPFTHYDDTMASLAAGKHVICEKPFALDVEQAEAMYEASRKAEIVCGVMHEFRFVPERAAIKELIENAHLKPLREIEITQLATWLRAGDTGRNNSWWFDRTRGGGITGALLSHLVDASTWLAGRPPLRSTGYMRTANPRRHDAHGAFESTVDDGSFALIDYGDGLIARITADAATAVDSFTLSVHAENRTAVASGEGMVGNRLFAVDHDETSELECKPSPYAKLESAGGNVPYVMQLLDEFIKALEGRPNALPTFEEAVATQRVLASVGFETSQP